MVFEWFATIPWPLAFLTLLVLCLLLVGVFTAVSMRFDPTDRTNDNVGRAALAFVSSAFIFVGAFTIITSWDEAATLHATSTHEVVAAQTLWREVRLLAPADTTVTRSLSDYAHAVLQDETGVGGELAPSAEAEDAFIGVESAATVVTERPGADTYRAEEIRDSLNDLKVARQDRVGELSNTIALPLIVLLLMMAALNLIGIGLFPGGTSRALKITFGVVVAVAAASLLTSVVLLESAQFIHPGLAQPFESLIADLGGR